LKIDDIKVKFICCDESGENQSMKDDLEMKVSGSNLSSQDLGNLRGTTKLREKIKLSLKGLVQG
jgi:hypothetical protein